MDPDVLREHLTKLHEELRTAPRAAPGSRELLGELMQDIQQLMARTAASDAASTATAVQGADSARNAADATPAPPLTAPQTSDVDSSLPGRLEKIAVLFEVDHPTLAASSRRLVDILGTVGL